LFSIPAAASVQVLDRHGGFELIRDAQGREGWVAASDLAAVIPGSDQVFSNPGMSLSGAVLPGLSG
jgi:hypothetical protein